MAAKTLFSFITEYYDHWQTYPSLQNIWDAATEAAEALKPSHNKQSAPLCSCGAEASFWSCDKCFDQYIPHP